MSILELMAAPFAECLVLVAIHTYLGIHVLKRRVIFVDLALAQIAALGTTVGFLFGIMPETPAALVFSMIFTFLGAAVFSITRFRHEKVPQEAVIGLTYAVSCAIAVLVVEKTRGAEHLKDILVGNLLWVTWADVAAAAIVYLIVGILHYFFRKRLFAISNDPEKAFAAGISVRAWDFLFYLTFGVVITFSTRVAGVLMVFVFLVAPAILAFMITNRVSYQLLIGWGTGTAVTVLGLYLSWVLDLPSGPAVIAFYGVALVIGGVIVFLVRAKHRRYALRSVLLGVAVTAFVVWAMWGIGRLLASTQWAISDEAHVVEENIARDQSVAATQESVERAHRRSSLSTRTERCVGANKIDKHLAFFGPEEQLQNVREKLKVNKRRGLEYLLLALADDELPLLYREEALDLLQRAMGTSFGYDAQRDVSQNQKALSRICDRIRVMKRSSDDTGG
jgi:zinc/manganese transport system permease protein